jgi:ATP-dependent Clp protease adaptor protein ClpS
MPTDPKGDQQGQTTVEERAKTALPPRWRVLLHNDDFTTMDFVVHVLVRHFQKSAAEATHIMLQVHHKGQGLAGIYPRDVAETKIAAVTAEAEANGMPLKLTAEPDA